MDCYGFSMKKYALLFFVLSCGFLFAAQEEFDLPETIYLETEDTVLEVSDKLYKQSETLKNQVLGGLLNEHNILDLSDSLATGKILHNIFVNFFENKERIDDYLEDEFIPQGITNQHLLNHAFVCRYLDLQIFLKAIRKVFFGRIPKHVFPDKDKYHLEEDIRDILSTHKMFDLDVSTLPEEVSKIFPKKVWLLGFDSKKPIKISRREYLQNEKIRYLFNKKLWNEKFFKLFLINELKSMLGIFSGDAEFYGKDDPDKEVHAIKENKKRLKEYFRDATDEQVRNALKILHYFDVYMYLPLVKDEYIARLKNIFRNIDDVQRRDLKSFLNIDPELKCDIANNVIRTYYQWLPFEYKERFFEKMCETGNLKRKNIRSFNKKSTMLASISYWWTMRSTLQKILTVGIATGSVIVLTIYNNLHAPLLERMREFIKTPSE